jgi:hypothetical protein
MFGVTVHADLEDFVYHHRHHGMLSGDATTSAGTATC